MGLMGSLPDLNGATSTVLFVITIFMLVAKHGNSFTSRGTRYQIYFLGWVNGVTKLSLLRLAHVGKIQRILNFSCTDFADWVHSPNRQRREGLKVRWGKEPGGRLRSGGERLHLPAPKRHPTCALIVRRVTSEYVPGPGGISIPASRSICPDICPKKRLAIKGGQRSRYNWQYLFGGHYLPNSSNLTNYFPAERARRKAYRLDRNHFHHLRTRISSRTLFRNTLNSI